MQGPVLSTKSLCACLLALVCTTPLFAQHHDMQGMDMPKSNTAKLQVKDDPAAQVLIVKLGPLDLPAHTDHMRTAQPAAQFLTIPL